MSKNTKKKKKHPSPITFFKISPFHNPLRSLVTVRLCTPKPCDCSTLQNHHFQFRSKIQKFVFFSNSCFQNHQNSVFIPKVTKPYHWFRVHWFRPHGSDSHFQFRSKIQKVRLFIFDSCSPILLPESPNFNFPS